MGRASTPRKNGSPAQPKSKAPAKQKSDRAMFAETARTAATRLFWADKPAGPQQRFTDGRWKALSLALFAIRILEVGSDSEYAGAMEEVLERLDRVVRGDSLVQAVKLVESFGPALRSERFSDTERWHVAKHLIEQLRGLHLDLGSALESMPPERLCKILAPRRRAGAPPGARGLLARVLEPDDAEARATIDRAIKKALERRARE